MADPKVSVVLVVRNAASIVSGTLSSLADQSFRDFEVVVVDGCSTDGTLDILRSFSDRVPLDIVSEPDRNLADALAKGLSRTKGDIVGILCADERYYPSAIEQAVAWFDAAPNMVMCGGRSDFLDDDGVVVDSYLADPFDIFGHLTCERVGAIVGAFFNRRLVGEELRYDASIPSCPDYELWGRLGFLYPPEQFQWFDVRVSQAFRSRYSMSFRAESFEQFCDDKIAHLDNLLHRFVAPGPRLQTRQRAASGIHMWAAEQLRFIDSTHPGILAHCAKAASLDPVYPRIGALVNATGRARYDESTGQITRTAPDRPGPSSRPVKYHTDPVCYPHWEGAAILARAPLTLRTADHAWGFSLLFPIPEGSEHTPGRYWASFEIAVDNGAVGVGCLEADQLTGEIILRANGSPTTVQLALPKERNSGVVFRSGGRGSSQMRILSSEILYDPQSD